MDAELIKLKKLSLELAEDQHIPELRKLINSAYKELADQGLNYSATYQDEEATRKRIQGGRAFILKFEALIIATILFKKENLISGKNSAYLSQLAIDPALKRNGIGTYLMDHCENLARTENFESIQLDTAKPAEHLVRWYQQRNYKIIGETRWEGKTYESWIFEKEL